MLFIKVSISNRSFCLLVIEKALIPRKIIDSIGKLHYNESFQAWNLLRLKKEIVDEFPALKEKRSEFSYKLMFCRSFEDLLKLVKKLKGEEVMPLLLWLFREG